MNRVFVLGVGLSPAVIRRDDCRLEELVYEAARAALRDANVSRKQLDHITIGASDELDGRPISSMLLSAPAGGYLKDEIRVTDSGITALCLAMARLRSGHFHLGIVGSWCKSSKTNIDLVTNMRAEPIFTRPIGLNFSTSDALFAQATSLKYGISEAEVAKRVVKAYQRAALNPRGLRLTPPTQADVAASPYESTPIRAAYRAPLTDGATFLVLATEYWLQTHTELEPLAQISGIGWANDSYQLGTRRLNEMRSAHVAWHSAVEEADVKHEDIDIVELDSQTMYHEAAYVRAFELDGVTISPSGGPFAQNPFFCSGLVNVSESVLQVAGRAGPTQIPGARLAIAHGCHGFAQQGNVVAVVQAPEEPSRE